MIFNRATKPKKSWLDKMKIVVAITILFIIFYSYVFTAGLFYRTFIIYNSTEQDVYISVYGSTRGKENNKDHLLNLYHSAWEPQRYQLKNHLVKPKQSTKLGFNMDDEYPSWIDVKNKAGKNRPIKISYAKPCAFIIENALDTEVSNKTNIKADDITCMFTDLTVSEDIRQ